MKTKMRVVNPDEAEITISGSIEEVSEVLNIINEAEPEIKKKKTFYGTTKVTNNLCSVEYKTDYGPGPLETTSDYLNRLGKTGWEHIYSGKVAGWLFKRPTKLIFDSEQVFSKAENND